MKKKIENLDIWLSISKGLEARFGCECGAHCFEPETVEYAGQLYHLGCGKPVLECCF